MIPIAFEIALQLAVAQWTATSGMLRVLENAHIGFLLYYGLAILFGLPLFLIFEFVKWRNAIAYFVVGFVAGYLLGVASTAVSFWDVAEGMLSAANARAASRLVECLYGLAVGLSALTFRHLAIDWSQKDQTAQVSNAP